MRNCTTDLCLCFCIGNNPACLQCGSNCIIASLTGGQSKSIMGNHGNITSIIGLDPNNYRVSCQIIDVELKDPVILIFIFTPVNQRQPIYLFFFSLNSVLCPFQDYFSSYETGQSVGGAKTGEPREKPPDTPASRNWLVSHVARAGLEPTPDTAVR